MFLLSRKHVSSLRVWLPLSLLLITTLVPVAAAGELPVTLELTGADLSTSYSDEMAWGFWDPNKYNAWLTLEEDKADLVEVRLLIPGDRFTLLLATELLPELSAAGTSPSDGTRHELTAELVTYDLGYGQWFRSERGSGIFAWVGLTRIEIDERQAVYSDPAAAPQEPVGKAVSRLWGGAVGADGELRLNHRLTVTGRLVVRWAKGDRDQDVLDLDPAVGVVRQTDTTSRMMYGGELGLCWSAMPKVRVEGGWRYRDWRHDNGLASFSGPFLRLALDI